MWIVSRHARCLASQGLTLQGRYADDGINSELAVLELL